MHAEKHLKDAVTIHARTPVFDWGVQELVHSYRLLYRFVWRDFKVRYKQTYLGPLWAVAQPLITVALMTFVFGAMARVDTGTTPYSVFALSGIIPWTLFASTSIRASGAIQSNAYLMSRVYFPRLVLPLSAGGTALVDALIAAGVLTVAMLLSGAPFSWTTPLGLPALLIPAALGQALGVFLCSAIVWVRDLRNVLPLIFQLGLFATPAAYPLEAVPAQWRWVAEWNPLTWPVHLFQSLVLGHPVRFDGAAVTLFFFGSLLVIGLFFFRRATRRAIDIW